MPKFLKCIEDCDAVMRIDEEDEREPNVRELNVRELNVRIPEGWIFYFLSSTSSEYYLCPVKKSTETNVTFDAQDKKSFKQGLWCDITDVNVLRQLKLDGLGNLSRLNIKLHAPKSCFEKI